MPVYLGLDSSTQSLTAIAIEVEPGRRRVLWETSLRFDELTEHGTSNGVLPHEDPLVVHSTPQVWVDALDRVLGRLAEESSIDLRRLAAIAGSGQQHGSVYLRGGFDRVLESLDPARPLAEQLASAYARATSPIWMDSSTGAQCDAIARAVGGHESLAQLTGSKAIERFTGPQIRKFFEREPEAYAATDRIHLVSSFLATLLAGREAPIDPGDGAGMNLMDLRRKDWAPLALEATAPDLRRRLPPIEESWHIAGEIARYWVDRHGYSPSTRVVTWSGDNPCSLIGVGLVSAGRVAISLGTSDTLFGFMPEAREDPRFEGHTFGSPTGHYMSLICFKNGSLARDRIRREHGLDWEGFSTALRESKPGGRGGVLLPWFEPEITPNVARAGARRYELEPGDVRENVRAVVEGQVLSMAIHSDWMDVETESIYATGGASCNREILGIIADAHDAEVFQFEVGNSAALGAALRAFHADEVAQGREPRWEDIVAEFCEPVRESRIRPDPARVAIYRVLREVYASCELHALSGEGDPHGAIAAFRRRFGR